ncbi:phosphotransferase enzyme family protein [Nocardioides cynanchi]|uniref:phosphotransferase enzyme family protein n=1 Tax=Nocardioides cynanchi TaxID=2558918 RepID=UPI001248A9A6|nr:aminoglycoside phosphotransferase family protein [Nocardioides cynanchi]
MCPDAQSVADAFGLGRAESLSEPVARGELGQVRRLVTDTGVWAVKESLDPVGDAEVAEAEASGAFHRACWEAGVPTPQPRLSVAGGHSAEVGGELLRAYGWVDLDDPDPGLDPVEVGSLLAALHAVRRPGVGGVHAWFEAPVGEREWRAVLKASRGAGAPYADRLGEMLPHLLAVESLLTPMVPVQMLHLDLWADNLRRRSSDGTACVIDFDNAGPGDPAREVAMLVVEFGQGDPRRQRLLYDAYRDAGGPGRVTSPEDLALTVAQLHHIGHRHIRMWLAARDSESRARSLAGVEEFLGQPLLLPDVERLVATLA